MENNMSSQKKDWKEINNLLAKIGAADIRNDLMNAIMLVLKSQHQAGYRKGYNKLISERNADADGETFIIRKESEHNEYIKQIQQQERQAVREIIEGMKTIPEPNGTDAHESNVHNQALDDLLTRLKK